MGSLGLDHLGFNIVDEAVYVHNSEGFVGHSSFTSHPVWDLVMGVYKLVGREHDDFLVVQFASVC